MNIFIILIPNDDKKEIEICEFEMDFKKFFCWHTNLRRLARSRPHDFLIEV